MRFGTRLLVKTFSNNPLAWVAILSMDEIESFKAAFAEQHPFLNDCWAIMYGLKLYFQQAGVLSKERSKDWKTKSGASSVSWSGTLEGTLCL